MGLIKVPFGQYPKLLGAFDEESPVDGVSKTLPFVRSTKADWKLGSDIFKWLANIESVSDGVIVTFGEFLDDAHKLI